MLAIWTRRLWPYVVIVALVAFAMLAVAILRGRHDTKALHAAHQATIYQEQVVYVAETTFVHDTVRAAAKVARYQAKRDTVLLHLTDTVQVKQALADCDSAIGGLQAALGSAGRLIAAHVRLESALHTELGISEKLRAPRYTLASAGGIEVMSGHPYTELTSSVRITERWSAVGRVGKLWAPGEPTRRYLLANYAF